MAFICEDRRGKAMIPAFTVEENMMLSSIDRYTKSGWFQSGGRQRRWMAIEALKIKCVGVSQPAKELSGGNQQKVVFAKALLTEPSIWLCDEPTQAVDVATRQEITASEGKKRQKKGKAVLYVSSDSRNFLEVADEVAVMAYGKVRKIFENKDLKPTDVLACCYEAEREENDRKGKTLKNYGTVAALVVIIGIPSDSEDLRRLFLH